MRLRKRTDTLEWLKKQKDAVILNPQEYKGKWSEFFGNDHPIHVELGMGKGRFISEMSAQNRDINFIGADMYDELVRRACEKSREVWLETWNTEPQNLSLVLMNVEFLEKIFAAGELQRIYLNFSDPWPKTRHADRRLTHPRFLKKYKEVLNDEGEIHLKTDSTTLFEFSLNSFADTQLTMRNISLDLHRTGIAPNLVMTEYEKKFFSQGMNIYRCEVVVGEKELKRDVLNELLNDGIDDNFQDTKKATKT